MSAYAEYLSAEAHKLLTDNRDLYVLQSVRTRNRVVAELPDEPDWDEVRQAYEFKYGVERDAD